MIIESTASTAVELAGNGLDVYPLHIFEEGCIALSMAINLRCNVRIRLTDSKRIRVYSEDLSVRCLADSLEQLPVEGPLSLLLRTIKYYSIGHGMDVVARGGVPEDTGLGTNASLVIALSAALNNILGSKYTQDDLIQIGVHLEMRSTGTWNGRIPYYPPSYGGVQCLWFGMESVRVESLELEPAFWDQFQRSMTLAFISSAPAASHQDWQIVKNYMDRRGATYELIKRNVTVAHSLRKAFLRKDLDAIAQMLEEDNRIRQSLMEPSRNPYFDRLATELREAGAKALKSFGPGNSGCLLVMHSPEKKEDILKVLGNHRIQIIPFAIDMEGPRIRQSR